LKQLEEYGFVTRKKDRNKPGKKNQDRKTLLYLSGSWGTQDLWEDFSSLMNEKFGPYVMKEVRPVLIEFFKKAIDMTSDKDFRDWLPKGSQYCPECGKDHQAEEFFNALVNYAMLVVRSSSYEWFKTLLENRYVKKKDFDFFVKKTRDDPVWAYSDQ